MASTETRATGVLDFEALTRIELHQEPPRWGVTAQMFTSSANAEALHSTFPREGFEWYSERQLLDALGKLDSEQARKHSIRTRSLIERGTSELANTEGLDDVWIRLGTELLSPAYRDALSELTDVDLSQAQMQTHFWMFEDGSWFSPHVDKPHKIVTHLMYFNPHWEPSWGGCLRLLRAGELDDVVAEVPPTLGSAVVLVNSAELWHGVTRLRGERGTRNVLQTWFWAS
jgi:hypothetical protein